MAEIPLAKAIESLREELGQAMVTGAGKPLQFALKEVHLELTVAITKSGEGSAQVGIWNILTLGSKGDYNHATTHTLTLTLTPHLAGQPTQEGIDIKDHGPEPLE